MFITLEGIDGAGKSTQARLLVEKLNGVSRNVVLTREPGGAPGAEEIRRLLVEGEAGRWSPETEILLFTAARRDHIERTIQPALQRGDVVVCDRFVDSTRAYQGSGKLRERVEQLHQLMIGLNADLTLIFHMDPNDGLARASTRADGEDRFESKGLDFQRQLRSTFLEIAAAEPERCHVINAAGSVDEVSMRAWNVVSRHLQSRPI